jgi:polysaccharide biosynthesis protein PslG
MPRNRRVLIVALLVAIVAGGTIVAVVATHHGKSHTASSAPNGSNPSSGSSTPSSGLNTTAIPGLRAEQFGISTGVQLFNEKGDKIDADMAAFEAMPTHWVRTAVRWDLVEPNSADQDDWTKVDRIVDDATADHLSLILDITGTPQWARAADATTNVQFPPDLQTYATFTGKIAQRYKGKVAAYELGNEPNHVKSFATPDPKLYEQVLQLSYPLIKAADPGTKVLTGGLGGTTAKGVIGGDEYLEALYKAGAKPYFDGVSYHPYTYPLLPSDDSGARSWSRMLHARQVMVDNGDADKQIWVTEYGAPTGGPGSVSQQQQAAIMYDAYRLWATYSWAGPLCWFDYRDKGTDTSDHGNFFGLYAKDGQPKVSLQQYESLVRSAS